MNIYIDFTLCQPYKYYVNWISILSDKGLTYVVWGREGKQNIPKTGIVHSSSHSTDLVVFNI